MEPSCACHGEPMRFSRDSRYKQGGFWRCRAKERERRLRYYHERMPFQVLARERLYQRRYHALRRRRERQLGRAD